MAKANSTPNGKKPSKVGSNSTLALVKSSVLRNGNDYSEIQNLQFDALFTQEQIANIESEYNATWGLRRRVTLQFLSLSKSEMIEKFGTNEEATGLIFEAIEMIQEYKQHLVDMTEITDRAVMNMICAATVLVPMPD